MEIEAYLSVPDANADTRFDRKAAEKCNYNSRIKYKIDRMYVAKPGWYHTIIAPLTTLDSETPPSAKKAGTSRDFLDEPQLPSTDEAIQNVNDLNGTYHNANVGDSEPVENSNSKEINIVNKPINHVYGTSTVDSYITNITEDGKRVSISLTIDL